MTNRERYPLGCRVRATPKYLTAFPRGVTVGVVVGYGHPKRWGDDHIRVQRDGESSMAGWHVSFWEPVEEVKVIDDSSNEPADGFSPSAETAGALRRLATAAAAIVAERDELRARLDHERAVSADRIAVLCDSEATLKAENERLAAALKQLAKYHERSVAVGYCACVGHRQAAALLAARGTPANGEGE